MVDFCFMKILMRKLTSSPIKKIILDNNATTTASGVPTIGLNRTMNTVSRMPSPEGVIKKTKPKTQLIAKMAVIIINKEMKYFGITRNNIAVAAKRIAKILITKLYSELGWTMRKTTDPDNTAKTDSMVIRNSTCALVNPSLVVRYVLAKKTQIPPGK